MKSYTDLEQSKKLVEILPPESADMMHGRLMVIPFNDGSLTPCWSLAALLNILPKIQGGKPIIALDDNYVTYPLPHRSDLHIKADNLVDACAEMILKLNELNLL